MLHASSTDDSCVMAHVAYSCVVFLLVFKMNCTLLVLAYATYPTYGFCCLCVVCVCGVCVCVCVYVVCVCVWLV